VKSQSHNFSDIQSIRFICAVPKKENEFDSAYRFAHETCEFALGVGPCGKVVTKLSSTTHVSGTLNIMQTTADGEVKTFTYKLSDILGRIVTTQTPRH